MERCFVPGADGTDERDSPHTSTEAEKQIFHADLASLSFLLFEAGHS